MSHSQFHSTKLFILGHAWLNLWDKHMTTGRINQVTTFLWPPIGEEFILWFEYVNPSLRDWSCSTTNRHSTLSPGLTSFRHTASCLLSLLQQELWSSKRTTLQSVLSLDCGGFSNVLVATSLAISKQSTFPHSLQAQNMCARTLYQPPKSWAPKVQFQISLFCRLTEMHCWFGTGQASQPHFKEKQRAYSIINDDISTLAKKAHLPQSLAYKYPAGEECIKAKASIPLTITTHSEKPTLKILLQKLLLSRLLILQLLRLY